VTALQVYGSLFYAGARTLARKLPSPADATRPVVLLRLRGKTRFGATAIDVDVLADYDERLRERGGRLYLEGLDPGVLRQLERTGKLAEVRLFPAEAVLGESLSRAYNEAEAWLA
jgi:SulP family sulfate permease